LINEHDEKFSVLAIGRMLNHPRRDLEVQRVVARAFADGV
jgi:hypothetical protein